jgi:protein ImuA
MTPAPLQRKSLRDPDSLSFLGDLTLLRGRMHEFCGPARHTAAMLVAAGALAEAAGPLIWIAPAHDRMGLNPQGMHAFIDPGRVLFVRPGRTEDLLWSMEEALRAGVAPLVVADLPSPPALTPVRRLHLAAEAGKMAGRATLGLLLTPGPGGAAGVETRWYMAPRHHGEDRIWQLERRRARMAPPAAWEVRADQHRFVLKTAETLES